jgi:hypothetical protein
LEIKTTKYIPCGGDLGIQRKMNLGEHQRGLGVGKHQRGGLRGRIGALNCGERSELYLSCILLILFVKKKKITSATPSVFFLLSDEEYRTLNKRAQSIHVNSEVRMATPTMGLSCSA